MANDPKRIIEAGLPDDELRVVDKMAEFMKHELDENKARKGGREQWCAMKARDQVLQTYYHTGKLQVAVRELEDLLTDKDSSRAAIGFKKEEVKEYAADVANHAMMVLDSLGLIDVPKPVKPVKQPEKKTFDAFS